MGRPQQIRTVERALEQIRQAGFPNLNIDLIYGAQGQTRESLSYSFNRVLSWHPEEVYLYPLYLRPKTGLDGRRAVWDEHRLELYRAGRDHLLAAGYAQVSMRHFRRISAANAATGEYSCQEDGMVALGPGARSYTRSPHYSTAFSVTRAAVIGTLQRYVQQPAPEFALVRHGIDLNTQDRKHRYLLKSLLRTEGVDGKRFNAVHGLDVLGAFPNLNSLLDCQLVAISDDRIRPTVSGLERSDAIGPCFHEPEVSKRMNAFELT